ncbi:methyl-accepting chemotaxis protein [Phormidesmis priestleyi]
MEIQSRHVGLKWFGNLSIGRKQAIALIVCELIPILGLGVGSTLMLISSLRTQLSSQAKSEVAVTETNYNIKVNQMGFGSRGQSDNPAIINVTKNQLLGQPISEDLRNQVKQILQNEVKARKIEYATLINKDLQIVVNANKNRFGEKITAANLADLVRQSIATGRQIKASETISKGELTQEAPPLPPEVKEEALIRYVVTPVRSPENQEVIGALVFGDVVDGKLSIVEDTLKAFGGGYSAVYLRRENGDFLLATSLDKPSANAQSKVPLSETSVLTNAVQAKGETVTQRLSVGGQIYTVAAKAVPNRIIETPDGPSPVYNDDAIAILVRGTPEDALNGLISNNLLQEAIVLFLSLLAIIGWSILLRRTVLKPIQHLEQATQDFAQGDRLSRAEVFSQDEVGQLAIAFNRMADNIAASETALSTEATRQEQQAKEAKALSDMTERMRRSLNTDHILQTSVTEVRDFFAADRVIIYRLEDTLLNATVIAESVSSEYGNTITNVVKNPLDLDHFEDYNTQSHWVVNDTDREDIRPRRRDHLRRFQVKAEMAAPIWQNDRVIGLICVHQCSHSRQWQRFESEFLMQLALQIGYTLDQSQLLQEKQTALHASESLKESLQLQILALLEEVEGASRGDLTVRADVTSGDIGTVADFFNAIVENLRQIVTQVKQSATQVSRLLGENEDEMRQLAESALQQTEETTHILNSVEQMTRSIQTVAERANQAATVARKAFSTAEMGESEMDLTVRNILKLRETIEEAAKKVKQLGEASQQISRIVSLINEIAVQTDLLAINASIEASRAGDQGRGFAIVASEVGELAARSAAATREIEQIVGMIQAETRSVVEVMGQGTAQVVEGAHSVKNAKQRLIHMVHVSRQIDELVQSISEATVSQVETSRSVTDLMQEIAQISTKTSDSSRRVSGVLRETVQVAQELQASVGMFEVGGDEG